MGNSWQITHQYSLLITHGKLTKSLTNIHHSSHMVSSWQITHQYSPLITCGKLMADHPPIFTTHHMWETHGRSPTNIHYSSHMGNSQQIAHRYSYCFRIGNKSMKTLHFVSGRGINPFESGFKISWIVLEQKKDYTEEDITQIYEKTSAINISQHRYSEICLE
jgi:hypothetical protein